MTRLLRALMITALLPTISVAGAGKQSQTSASVDTRQQVLDLEDQWVIAEEHKDESLLRRILDDKFIVTFGAGKPVDKATFIKALLSSSVDPTHSQQLTDRTVIIDRDTAVVVGTDTERGTRKGAAYTAVARYTATYIRRNGRWVALAEHLVEVPQAK